LIACWCVAGCVCDNLATHKTPLILGWLARHPRFRLHFTSAGSSWINHVERWFGYLTAQRIRRGVHKSVQALEADIRAWIENWNANPRPFAWIKTADEILDSLDACHLHPQSRGPAPVRRHELGEDKL
jgi:hypothetical protein